MSEKSKLDRILWTDEELAVEWGTNIQMIRYLSWDVGLLRPALFDGLYSVKGYEFSDSILEVQRDTYIHGDERAQWSRPDVMYINVNHKPTLDGRVEDDYDTVCYVGEGDGESFRSSSRIYLNNFVDFEGERITPKFVVSYVHRFIEVPDNVSVDKSVIEPLLYFKEADRAAYHVTKDGGVRERSEYLALNFCIAIDSLHYFYTNEEINRFKDEHWGDWALQESSLVPINGVSGEIEEYVGFGYGVDVSKRSEMWHVLVDSYEKLLMRDNRPPTIGLLRAFFQKGGDERIKFIEAKGYYEILGEEYPKSNRNLNDRFREYDTTSRKNHK